MCTEPVLRSSTDFLAIAHIFWLTQLNGFAVVGLCSSVVGTEQAVQHSPDCPLVFPGVSSLGCGCKPGCSSLITCQLRHPYHQLLIGIGHNSALLLWVHAQLCAGAVGTALTAKPPSISPGSGAGNWPASQGHWSIFDHLKSTFWCLHVTCALHTGEPGSMKLIWMMVACEAASLLAEGGASLLALLRDAMTEDKYCSISKLGPRMYQESPPQLTTGSPAMFNTKWLKRFKVSSLFQMVNKSSCVWTKQLREVAAVRTRHTAGEGPSFVAANVPLRSVQSVQLSLPLLHLSSRGFPRGKLCTELQKGTGEVVCWGKATWPDTAIRRTVGKPWAEAQLQVY